MTSYCVLYRLDLGVIILFPPRQIFATRAFAHFKSRFIAIHCPGYFVSLDVHHFRSIAVSAAANRGGLS